MKATIFIFSLIPFIGFLLGLIIPKKDETVLSRIAFITLGTQLVGSIIFFLVWVTGTRETVYIKELVIYQSDFFEMFIDLCYDKITAVYLTVGAYIAFLVTVYSRNYLHKEGGYKRFFITIMFFYFGYNTIVLSGNLTTMFIGWEVAGISSFLLIAFYRNRYLPVQNAVKIFSVYRIGDIMLILAMWLSHHMFHENVLFMQLKDENYVMHVVHEYPHLILVFSIFVIIASAIKSAQFPFSSWLPRAMEGPTPSSAVFYGSLAVHIGVLILLRTYPLWHFLLEVKIIVISLGAITFLLGSITAQVQSSVKGQIAYTSLAQIGLMFIEVALGFHNLALVHFAGNALLRSYQLLISPSIVTYLIREQFYLFSPYKYVYHKAFYKSITNTIYMLSLKEWYLDSIMYQTIWNSFKRIGRKLHFVSEKWVYFIVAIVTAVMIVNYSVESIQIANFPMIAIIIAAFGFLLSLRSFTEKKNPKFAWFLILVNHLTIALSISMHSNVDGMHVSIYLGGILLAAIVGYAVLYDLEKKEGRTHLKDFQGHCYEYPVSEFIFLIACMGLFGFPVTSAFLGMELMFGYIHLNQVALLVFISLGLLVNSLSIIRIYSRIFLGPHIKTYHESARRSS